MAVNATFTVTRDDGSPIGGATLQVFTSSLTFVSQAVLDDDGQATISLGGSVGGTPYKILLSKFGWTFPPNNWFDIEVTDPPNPDNSFEFEGELGLSTQPVLIQINDDQVVPQAVEGVTVVIRDSLGNYVTRGVTDSDGGYLTYLQGSEDPGTQYTIYLHKDEVTFYPGSIQIILVRDEELIGMGDEGFGDGGFGVGPVEHPLNTFDVEAHVRSVPESSDPELCRLSGHLTDVGLSGVKDATIRFRPIIDLLDSKLGGFDRWKGLRVGSGVVVQEVVARADADGYVEVNLIRGGWYDVHLYGVEHPDLITQPVLVPDSPGYRLEDVLFPYIADVTLSPSSLTMEVGESESVDVAAVSNIGSEVVGATDFLTFSSSDEGVATVHMSGDGIAITAIGSGTATISVVRKGGTYVERFDALEGLTDSVVVTVS